MKILVTGAKGQLGYDVVKELQRRNMECRGVSSADFDKTDDEATRRYIIGYRPDAVVHCSAYTAVDKAEDEPELCMKINAGVTANIAGVCKDIGAKMIYISTDYVFDGTGERAYEPIDEPCPLSVYGRTKAIGEENVRAISDKHFIVRISWAFGANGDNFVKTMLRLGRERETVSVVSDQIGSPTYTADLAVLLCDMLATDKYGTYHATNEGFCSKAEFASEIFRLSGLPAQIKPITSAEYPTKAARPKNARLSKICLADAGFHRLPCWKDALRRYIKNELGY